MSEKASFFKRLLAYIVDFIIITFISAIITTPFVNNDNVKKLTEESNSIVSSYAEKKIDINTYIHKAQDVSFDLARENCVASVVDIILLILYFVVFQIYRGGQTIGKMLFKLKVVDKDSKDLTMNGMLIRALVDDFIIFNILMAIVALFSKNIYFYGSLSLVVVQYVVVFVSVIMVLFGKEGKSIGDFISHTKVIEDK